MAGPRRFARSYRRRVNGLPDDVRKLIDMALDEQRTLDMVELATTLAMRRRLCPDAENRWSAQAIASPAYIVSNARDEFHTKTTRPNEMWQTILPISS
jgi:hypothetical protein